MLFARGQGQGSATDAQLRPVFDAIDSGRSGYITQNELSAALLKAGKSTTPNDVAAMLRTVDTSKDGKISFDEFKAFYAMDNGPAVLRPLVDVTSLLLQNVARLGRADLQRTPPARHEFSYTRFAPGASRARHVDEHHEETKGTEGWRAPTRRSVTWLVYLNERDVAGGRLRAYERRRPIALDAQVLRPASFVLLRLLRVMICAAMACRWRRRTLDADGRQPDDAIDAAPARRWAPRPTATCRSAGSGPPRPTPWNGPCSWRRGSTTRRATARCASATPSCRGRSTRRRRST